MFSRLLLAPDAPRVVGIARAARLEPASLGNGIELLEAHDARRRRSRAFARARPAGRSRPCRCTARRRSTSPSAELVGLRQARGWNARPVRSSSSVRHRRLVAQQALRRHHDQRLAERRGASAGAARGSTWPACVRLHDLDVVLGAELQEALEPRQLMLRPLALVAVRQQHHEAAHAQPLALARADELVDDDLRAVGEVAELRLPHHQAVRVGEAVAVLEAEHAVLGQQAVDRPRSCACSGARWFSGMYCSSVVWSMQHRVALAERAAPAVLARQPDRVPSAAASRRPAPRRSPSRCRSPASIALRRCCEHARAACGWTLKPLGHGRRRVRPSSRSISAETAVLAALSSLGAAREARSSAPSSQSALLRLVAARAPRAPPRAARANASSIASASARLSTPSLSTRRSA